MKRSLHVTAPLLVAAALGLLTACRRPEMQRCVDEQSRVVDDNLCKNQPNQQQMRSDGHGGFIPFIVPYRYYYGGLGGYGLGSIVSGGGYNTISGHSYSSSTNRGGFGSTHGGSEGGHGSGEGGGHGGGGE